MATINLGNLTFTHKGDYDGSTAYVKNDVVYYSTNGNAYIAKQATTGNVPTNATYWNQFAQGSDGIWNAGLSLGSANEILQVNSSANALEFTTKPEGKIKEVFTYNYNQGNISNGSYAINQNFTPTVAGKCIIMWTLNYRGNSNAHVYWQTDFDNGTTDNTSLRVDGSSTAHENTGHNHGRSCIAVTNNSTIANQEARVRVKNTGGDTVNDSGDGDYEQTLTIFII